MIFVSDSYWRPISLTTTLRASINSGLFDIGMLGLGYEGGSPFRNRYTSATLTLRYFAIILGLRAGLVESGNRSPLSSWICMRFPYCLSSLLRYCLRLRYRSSSS